MAWLSDEWIVHMDNRGLVNATGMSAAAL